MSVSLLDLFPSSPESVVLRKSVGKERGQDGKLEAKYVTVRRPPSAEDAKLHLAGKVCIVAKPDLPDGTCTWAMLDFDFYLDAAAKMRILDGIIALKLPLTSFESKSGGLHSAVFFAEPVPTPMARALLESWKAQLGFPGHPKVEVFPKPVQDGKIPFGIALPFFGEPERFKTFEPQRYGLKDTVRTLLDSNGRTMQPAVEQPKTSVTKPALAGDKIPRGSHDTELTRIGGRLRYDGLEERAICSALIEVCEKRCEDYGSDYKQMCAKIARSVCRYELGQADAQSDWRDPQPLGAELPPVQKFNTKLLPVCFQPLVEDISDRMQVPEDYAATCTVVALAGCVNRRALIRPKAKDTEWVVVPNLWGGIVAPPGFLKSPIMKLTTAPLAKIEEVWRAEHQQQSEDFGLAKEQAELRHQAWKEQFKMAVKNGTPIPVQPDATLTAPVQRRLVLGDSTFEKTHQILADNPAGLLVVRDELTGWLADLEKQGRESERAFFLQAWNGDSGFTVDRIGRGSIYVPAVCLSLLGNIQPARLRWFLANAISGGPADDGLLQRLQLLVWPDAPKNWTLVDRPPDTHAAYEAEQVYRAATRLSADSPVRLRFSADAQELFYSWMTALETLKIRGDAGLHPAVVAHLSKYRSLLPTLAGLFQLADKLSDWSPADEEIDISLHHASQAVEFVAYLESHAHRVYSCLLTPEMEAAHELSRHIKRGDLPGEFTTRSIYRKGWVGLDSPERVQAVLAVLEDAGWVRARKSVSTGGRPAEAWELNPQLRVGMHEK